MVAKYPASEINPDQENHELTLYVTKGVTGKYVGHIKEVPEVIVQADSEKELEDEATKSVNLLWVEYPEMHDKIFPKHSPAIKGQEVIKEKAQYRLVEVTIPQF